MNVKSLASRLTPAFVAPLLVLPAAASEVVFTTDQDDGGAYFATDAPLAQPSSVAFVPPAEQRTATPKSQTRLGETSPQPARSQAKIVDRFVQPASRTAGANRLRRSSRSGLKLRPMNPRSAPRSNAKSVAPRQRPTADANRGRSFAARTTQSVRGEAVSRAQFASAGPMPLPMRKSRPAAATSAPAAEVRANDVQIARYDQMLPQADPVPKLPRPVPIKRAAAASSGAIKPKPPVEKSRVARCEQLLLRAHKLSQSADSIGEYNEVGRLCAAALDACDREESRRYGKQLAAWALNRRGEVRAEQGENDLAAADFKAASELDAESWRPLHNRSVLHAQAGRFADAFDDVARVIELNPNFAKAYSNRATLYVQAGNAEAAVADYRRAVELDPELVAAEVGHGRVCHMLGRLDEALASLDRAIEMDDSNADFFCSRADLHADLGEYEAALSDYAEAVKIEPQHAHAYRNGAWLLATCPDESFRDAENALYGARRALECDYGQRHAALDTMAAALANAGRYDEAIKAINEAIRLAPQDAAQAYRERLAEYEAGRPYRTEPVGMSDE